MNRRMHKRRADCTLTLRYECDWAMGPITDADADVCCVEHAVCVAEGTAVREGEALPYSA